MDLKMEVYSPRLELLGLVEIQKSVIWEQKAFSAGSFTVQSLLSDKSRPLLAEENIIWIADDTAGIIKHVERRTGGDGPCISVSGWDLTGILRYRVLSGQYDLSGTVPDIMRYLVDDCAIHPARWDGEARRIPGLVLAEAEQAGPQESIRTQRTGGFLLEALEELGEAYGVAFGVRFNPQVPQMEFWARPGVNRTVGQTVNEPVFYSTELDDVLSSEYSYDSSDYCNVALVAGEGEGNERVMVTVSNAKEDPGAAAVVGRARIGKSRIGVM